MATPGGWRPGPGVHERWERGGRFSGEPDPEVRPKDEYHRADAAKDAFERVARLSRNPELRARALFMASLCLQGYTRIYVKEDRARVARGPYVTDNPLLRAAQG